MEVPLLVIRKQEGIAGPSKRAGNSLIGLASGVTRVLPAVS